MHQQQTLRAGAIYKIVWQHGVAAKPLALTTHLVGHVHEPALYYQSSSGKLLHFKPLPGNPIPISKHRKWVSITGSLGQPRDGNPAANYALFELDQEIITFNRIDYDHHKAATKVEQAGLPLKLALRLLNAK